MLTEPMPASYVLAHTNPTVEELRWGLAHGWITNAEAVELALTKMKRNDVLDPVEERLALLLSDELEEVPAILDIDSANLPSPDEVAADLWKYLAVRRAVDTLPGLAERLDAIESIWCDFGHPKDLAGMVRFMPAPEGEAVGLPAMEARLNSYLSAKSRDFSR